MSGLWLLMAFLSMLAGMGWLALSLPAHWKQVRPQRSEPASGQLRLLGWTGVLVSALACLAADHPSMAILVWLMLLALTAVLVALLLSTRPHWLQPLARCVSGQPPVT